ncbi:MAG TPA: ABC transporter permease, partial [Actinomycetales bacterium]|nr:ABC transporter permease [Actinomycetales bacterium]
AVGVALGAVMTGSGVPFALSAPDVSLAALGLILLGLVGAGVAVARIAAIDPATALGGNR